jgi:hypothetical protein
MPKFKCRPAEECYHADPYYEREIEVPSYSFRCPESDAAAMYCEDYCNRRSEYEPFDVQVLTDKGWETFEVAIHSAPEFSASRKRGVPPAPRMNWCDNCGEAYPHGTTSLICDKCEEDFRHEDRE